MLNEEKTRKELIDKQLVNAGWNINDRTQVSLEFDITIDLPEDISEPKNKYQGRITSYNVCYTKLLRKKP